MATFDSLQLANALRPLSKRLEAGLRLAEQQGWTLSEQHIYRDDGFSGASLNRPGLDRLRDTAAQAPLMLS